MTMNEASDYFEKLTDAKKARFNLLVSVALRLGKPMEGAYQYAHTIMESEKNEN